MQLHAFAAFLAVLVSLAAAAPLRPKETLGTHTHKALVKSTRTDYLCLGMRATADPDLLSDGYDHNYKPSKRVTGTADPELLSDGYDHGYGS